MARGEDRQAYTRGRSNPVAPLFTEIAGDGSNPAVMKAAGIAEANILAAVTGDDEANLVISLLARSEFHVPGAQPG